jgi:nitrite reductase/ring-hydroxylating ferredoxin subunit
VPKTERQVNTGVAVGRPEEFTDRTITVRQVGAWEVGIVRWGEMVYAVRNVCPHQGAPICLGRVGPKIVAPPRTVGAMEIDETVPVLACGWHGWEFDVRDGSPAWGQGSTRGRTRRYRLQTIPVTVTNGLITLHLPAHTDREVTA